MRITRIKNYGLSAALALTMVGVAGGPANAAIADWEFGTPTISGDTLIWTYPNTGTADATVTLSYANAGPSAAIHDMNWGADSEFHPWVTTPQTGHDDLTTAYTPQSVYDAPGMGIGTKGDDVCPGTLTGLQLVDCSLLPSAYIPVLTFTFSKPVTNWNFSVNDLGGFSTGVMAMYPDLEITSGQTVTRLSGSPNFGVSTSGRVIKDIHPVINQDPSNEGVGSGSVRINGTYSTVTMRMHYFAYGVNAGDYTAHDAPDWIAMQWSANAVPVASPLTKKLHYGSMAAKSFAVASTAVSAEGSSLTMSTASIAKSGTTAWGNSVTVKNKGKWTIADGVVSFKPSKKFVGKTTIRYRVQDASGDWAYSTYTVIVNHIPKSVNGGR